MDTAAGEAHVSRLPALQTSQHGSDGAEEPDVPPTVAAAAPGSASAPAAAASCSAKLCHRLSSLAPKRPAAAPRSANASLAPCAIESVAEEMHDAVTSPANDCRDRDSWGSLASPDGTCSDPESHASSCDFVGGDDSTLKDVDAHERPESDYSEEPRSETELQGSDDDSDVRVDGASCSDGLLTPQTVLAIQREAVTPAWKPERLRRRRDARALASDGKELASDSSSESDGIPNANEGDPDF